MSEDEILEIIKDYIDNGMTDKTVKLDTIIYLDEAIKELYNMYQKEKEKNSKYIIHLTDEQYRKVIDNAQRDIEEKWKDKIKEKMKIIENECKTCKYNHLLCEERKPLANSIKYCLKLECYDVLKSLLEEN